jgi:hypothetical protein
MAVGGVPRLLFLRLFHRVQQLVRGGAKNHLLGIHHKTPREEQATCSENDLSNYVKQNAQPGLNQGPRGK